MSYVANKAFSIIKSSFLCNGMKKKIDNDFVVSKLSAVMNKQVPNFAFLCLSDTFGNVSKKIEIFKLL